MKTFFTAFLFVIFLSTSVFARTVKGHAVVSLENKWVGRMRLDQAIVLGDASVNFVGLSDFGEEVLSVILAKDQVIVEAPGGFKKTKRGGKLKKLISIPVTGQDFVKILNYDRPVQFAESTVSGKRIWLTKNDKKLRVEFSDFVDVPHAGKFPKRVTLTHNDVVFDLTWQNVTFTPSSSR